MSTSLLNSSSSSDQPKKRASLVHTVNMMGISFSAKDALQVSTLKAVCNVPGLPKKKHVDALLSAITNEPNKWEEIILSIDALSNWQTDKIVSCKVMTAILQLLQTGPALTGMYCNELLILLSSVQEQWAQQDLFLYEFAAFLRLRIHFLEENPSYHNHFNLNSMSMNGLSLPENDVHTILPVASRLLGYQNKLVQLLKVPFKNNRDSAHFLPSDPASSSSGGSFQALSQSEALTFQQSLIVLYEDAYCFHVALTKMMTFVLTNASGFAPEIVSAVNQQYAEVFASLSASHLQLTTECGFEVTGFGKTNPLAQQLKRMEIEK